MGGFSFKNQTSDLVEIGQAVPLISTPIGGEYLPVDSVITRTGYPELSEKYPVGGLTSYDTLAMTLSGDRFHGGASNGSVLVIARQSSANHVLISLDFGYTWQTATLPITSSGWRGLIYGNGVFVMAQYGTTAGFISSDGVSWSSTTIPNANWNSSVFGGGVFVLLANGGNVCASSTDGTNWNSRTLPSSATWNVGFWDSFRSRFYVQSSGATDAAWSSNGQTWSALTAGLNPSTTGCALPSGRYIVVGSTATYATSDNGGVSWTSRTLPISKAGAWRCTPFGNGAVLVQDGSPIGLLSADGITWTTFYLPYTATVWTVRFEVPGKPYLIISANAELSPIVRLYPAIEGNNTIVLRGPYGYHVRVR